MTFCLDARTATDHFPGIGRSVSSLAQAMLGQLTSEEQLLLLHDPTRPSRWQLPGSSGQLKLLESAVSPFSIAQQWAIPYQLRGQRVSVYHSPYYLMPYWPGAPTILTIYDLIPQQFPQTVSRQARLFFGLATSLALRRATHIITISEATRRDLLAAYRLPPSRVTAVSLAPDSRFRPQAEADLNRIRRRFELPDSFALYFGINKPHKNLVRLLEAWRWMLDEPTVAPPLLVIAGAWDPRYPEAKRLCVELGLETSVRFLGPIPDEDLPGLYGAASVFIFPSLYEGFGLPVIEAMACGTAVACGDRSSLPEVGGEAALYFDPTQPKAIGRVVNRLLGDEGLRQELSRRGLEQANKFTWEKTAAATLEIYRGIAG